MADPTIFILMAVRNGARHLPEQLASLQAQHYPHWKVMISDDGSSDESLAICRDFASTQPEGRVDIVAGPQAGATMNFLHLIEQAPAGTTLAFSDQDDVWLPRKLARAAEALIAHPAAPVHYSARTFITGPDLGLIGPSPRFLRPFGLRNALVQACTAGNTSVFNPRAAAILKAGAASARAAGIVSHDWWSYQLISAAGGAILKDDEPVLLYRQHGTNEMGRNDTWQAQMRRLSMLFDGSFASWLLANNQALRDSMPFLPAASNNIVERFGEALHLPGPMAARELAKLGIYRHDRPGTAALYLAAATGRLRSVS